jgi:hypothetical protein
MVLGERRETKENENHGFGAATIGLIIHERLTVMQLSSRNT